MAAGCNVDFGGSIPEACKGRILQACKATLQLDLKNEPNRKYIQTNDIEIVRN